VNGDTPEDGSNHERSRTAGPPGRAKLGNLTVVAVVAAIVGGLVGYTVAPRSDPVSAASSASASFDPFAVPSSSLPPPTQLELGETGTLLTGATVTVLSWIPGKPDGWPPHTPGFLYSRAIVRYCAGPGMWNLRVLQLPYLFNLVADTFMLSDPEAHRWFGLTEFASYRNAVVSPGECVTGTIVFQTKATQRIVAVRFTGHGRIAWNVADIASGASPPPKLPHIDWGASPAPSPEVSPVIVPEFDSYPSP